MYVAGGMQPELLGDLAKDNRAENGFLSRLLNVFPDVDVKQPYSKARLSADTFANYHKYLGGLDTIPETINITLSRDAEVMYSDWYNKNAERSNNSPTGYLKGVYGKLDVYALRFAITVYGMNLICNQNDSLEIDGATMKTAIDITEYFRATALKVYDKIFSDSKSKSIDKKAAIIYMSSIGKSQSDIAKALDIGQSYVSQVLKKTKGNK
jgi:hypothetical protein